MNLKIPTPAQQRIYEAIKWHFSITGSSPSYQQLGDATKRSLAVIFKHVHGLEKLGILKLRKGRITGLKAHICPTCGHRKTAGKCDDPEVHTDFDATFKEMCERGKRIDQLEKELAEARA